MPFQSEKQRKYLWANEPEIAREWTDKYGSRVKKDNGGITNLFGIPEQHMTNWGDALTAKNKPWTTTPEYHQWGTHDFTKQKSKQLANIPYIGGVASRAFEAAAPYLAFGASPFYDIPQAFWKYNQDPGKYETNNKWDKINAYFPDLQGTTVSGILNAIDMEDPLSAAYNRMIGAGKVGIESKINRQNQIQNLLKKGWGAIKNEFGGSAEAAEIPIQNNNMILPPTWSMTDDLEAQNIRPTFDSSDEEQDYYNQIRNKIGKMPTIKDPNIFQRFRNRFYKPAAGAVNYGGKTYSPAQLNKMNALGGYYSEPARQQRRLDARRTNILNRAAKGKAVGNVNKLLGKYGYTGTPGSGTLQFTGTPQGNPNAGAGYSRSDDSWSSSTFRRGGLASLWQR